MTSRLEGNGLAASVRHAPAANVRRRPAQPMGLPGPTCMSSCCHMAISQHAHQVRPTETLLLAESELAAVLTLQASSSKNSLRELNDPPRTRTWNLRLRGPTPYPLGQRAVCIPAKPRGCARRDSLPRRHVLGQMRPWGLGQNRSAPWECNLPCASSMPAGPPWRTEAPMWRRYVRPSAPAISMMPCEAAVVGHASHKPRTLAEWSEALA